MQDVPVLVDVPMYVQPSPVQVLVPVEAQGVPVAPSIVPRVCQPHFPQAQVLPMMQQPVCVVMLQSLQAPAPALPIPQQPLPVDAAPGAACGVGGGPAAAGTRPGAAAEGPQSLLRVAARTKMPGLEVAMTKRLLAAGSLKVEGMGAESIAKAMRAVVVVEGRLRREGLMCAVVVHFAVSELGRQEAAHPLLRLHVSTEPQRDVLQGSVGKVVRVVQNSVVGSIAGAIAQQARGAMAQSPVVAVRVHCGQSDTSINSAAKSIALARLMLQRDKIELTMHVVLPPNSCDGPNIGVTVSVMPHHVTEL